MADGVLSAEEIAHMGELCDRLREPRETLQKRHWERLAAIGTGAGSPRPWAGRSGPRRRKPPRGLTGVPLRGGRQ